MIKSINKYPISIAEMRERYLKLYSAAVNDVMRFDYKVNCSLPSSIKAWRWVSNLSLMNFKKIKLNKMCLYSIMKRKDRILSVVSTSLFILLLIGILVVK